MLRCAYEWMNDLSGGSLAIVTDAVRRFEDAHAPQAAAGMAYYTLFSLFPLLLLLVAAGSSILEREQAYQLVVGFITDVLPASQDLIEINIQRVLEERGPVGLIGLIGYLWSATGVFATLAHNVSRAWPGVEPRSLMERRLVALGMLGGLVGLLVLWLASTAALSLLPLLQVCLWGVIPLYETLLWRTSSHAIPWVFALLLFLALYRWVPNAEVRWPAALWGALVASLAWQAATAVFAWYLRSGLARYRLVYGSLGVVVALMFWIYLSSWIALFGAHLSAAVSRHHQA